MEMKWRQIRGRDERAGWLFALPWLVGFLLLFLWPFLVSIYWSFCEFDLVNPPVWRGLENYERLANDLHNHTAFGLAIANTLYYVAFSVPLSMLTGVLMASLLSRPMWGQGIMRTLVYLPSVLPLVAVSILWVWLLDPRQGWVNWLLSFLGIPPQNWLNQSRSLFSLETLNYMSATPMREWSLAGSKDGLILLTLWGVGNYMVIYLAAIGDIPRGLHEACELDGAGPVQRFFHVTLPMLSPVLFFHLVIGLIRGVQTFTSVYILSEGTGEPGGSLTMVSLQLFISAFTDLEIGYASAMSWVMVVILSIATLALFRTSSQWVHYRTTA